MRAHVLCVQGSAVVCVKRCRPLWPGEHDGPATAGCATRGRRVASHGVRCIVLGSIAGRRCAFDRESLSDALVRYCSRVLTRVAPRAMTQWQHDGSGKSQVRCPRARATPVFRTRPLSSRERPRETRAAPRGARGEAGRKRTRTRPHTERGHTQTAEALCWLGWRGPVATRLHHARLLECLPVGPGRQRSADSEKHDRARHDLFNSVATIADPGR